VTTLARAEPRNIGEACTTANRFHVASAVTDEFSDRLAARMTSRKGRVSWSVASRSTAAA
jgi:acyl-CoA reductase-like NAD-dependent aldehyde dehydrogenase